MHPNFVPWFNAGGTPDPIAVYQPYSAAGSREARINIVNPGIYDAVPGVAPSHDPTAGWIYNGLTQYLATGVSPVAGGSLVIKYSNVTSAVGDRCLAGSNNGVNRNLWIGPNGTGSVATYLNGGALTAAPVLLSGVLVVAGNKAYRNGVQEPGSIAAWNAGVNNQIYIGCNNYLGAPLYYIAVYVQAFSYWATTLTPAQVAAVSYSADHLNSDQYRMAEDAYLSSLLLKSGPLTAKQKGLLIRRGARVMPIG